MDELIVLYEDNHIIVTVKPQNIPSQGDSTGDLSQLDIVKNYIKTAANKVGNAFVGLVHRLDRPTGGVMVFAKTSKAAARLSQQIRDGELEKRYLAVVAGRPKEPRGRLVNALLKDETANIVKIVPPATDGAKRAELDYVVLESSGKLSLVDIKLITGRSHQARAQMAGLNCPIYADQKYGAAEGKGGNLALWAYSLKFEHPTTKQAMVFKVFPPETTPWQGFAVSKYVNVVKPE
ncbi:MAG: RluA family pseudouridine synthase [Firmicutes bacterium]|nr:RluA family pseudouridine synthase [Bacillota bacterium]